MESLSILLSPALEEPNEFLWFMLNLLPVKDTLEVAGFASTSLRHKSLNSSSGESLLYKLPLFVTIGDLMNVIDVEGPDRSDAR